MNISTLLLGDSSPSLRWRAARELEDANDEDADIRSWRTEIDQSAEIGALLTQLAAAETRPYLAGYLLCQLAYLGYRGPATAAAVERIFSRQQPDGSWSTPPTSPGPIEGARFITMHTVVPLRGIAAAGFATDPRAEHAYERLLNFRLPDGSWPAGPKADLGKDGRPTQLEREYRRLTRGLGCPSATTGDAAVLLAAARPRAAARATSCTCSPPPTRRSCSRRCRRSSSPSCSGEPVLVNYRSGEAPITCDDRGSRGRAAPRRPQRRAVARSCAMCSPPSASRAQIVANTVDLDPLQRIASGGRCAAPALHPQLRTALQRRLHAARVRARAGAAIPMRR